MSHALDCLIARRTLVEELGREPTEREIRDELYRMGLDAIHRRALARPGLRPRRWSLTDAGRAALEQG
jgi:hypothetical protein